MVPHFSFSHFQSSQIVPASVSNHRPCHRQNDLLNLHTVRFLDAATERTAVQLDVHYIPASMTMAFFFLQNFAEDCVLRSLTGYLTSVFCFVCVSVRRAFIIKGIYIAQVRNGHKCTRCEHVPLLSQTDSATRCQSKSCQLLHNCRNKLYKKSRTNRSNGITRLQSTDV